MASDNSPGWLPPGWTMHVKEILDRKVKFYLDLEGRKFYSKPQVYRHLKTIDNGAASEKTHNADGLLGDVSQGNEDLPSLPLGLITELKTLKGGGEYKHNGDIKRDESASEPEWLPQGWVVETKVKGSGKRYKCYIDPESGRKFFSKPEVSRYLETVKSSKAGEDELMIQDAVDCLTRDGSASKPNASKEDKVSEWLPDGWIVEVKTRETGTRSGMKEKCFTDPASGQKFFSKQQVLDYLATTNSSGAGKGEVKEDKASSELDMPLHSESIDVGHNISEKNKVTIRKFTNNNKVISRAPVEGLPPGWIKEVRVREHSHIKDPYYIDPLSGYIFRSKLDALRYLDSGDIEKCAIRVMKSDINEEAPVLNYLATTNSSKAGKREVKEDGDSSEVDMSLNSQAIDVGHNIPKKKIVTIQKFTNNNKVISRAPAEGLPPGWIKEVRVREHSRIKDPYYIDPLSGYVFRSTLDALRYLDSGDIEKCAIRVRKRDINEEASLKVDKASSELDMSPNSESIHVGQNISEKKEATFRKFTNNNKVISRAPAEGLPPGWIKEDRIRRGSRVTDPYYIDPVSGYIFGSKPDALRYLDSGDIEKCAVRPMKRDTNEEAPVCALDRQKPVNTTIRRQLFEDIGKQAENPKEKQDDNRSTDAIVGSIPTTEVLEKVHTNEICTDPEKQAHVVAETASVSTPSSDILQEMKTPERKTNQVKKSKKNSEPNFPARSSKRLKGLEPEIKGDPLLNEHAIRAASRENLKQVEVQTKQVEVQPEIEKTERNGVQTNQVEVLPEIEKTERNGHLEDNKAIQDKQAETVKMEEQTNDEKVELIPYPLGDCAWTDPCLEFAFKTLTGEIPVDVPSLSVSCQQGSVSLEAAKNEHTTKLN